MNPARQTIAAKDVRRELLPDQSPELLQELHLLTRKGDLNADALRKLKQINHLVGFIAPDLQKLFAESEQPVIVDAGAGNAYLGFILYELFCKPAGKGRVINIELRNDLAQRGQSRANKLGYERLQFVQKRVSQVLDTFPQIDVVVALHACDNATDEAIALGVRAQAPLIALVPCCQAEVAKLLQGGTAVRQSLGSLWRHGWHRREFGAHLTNVIRGLLLEAHGYQVTVTELAGWEHSLKNELILARKVQKRNSLAIKQLRDLLAELPNLPMQLLADPGIPDLEVSAG